MNMQNTEHDVWSIYMVWLALTNNMWSGSDCRGTNPVVSLNVEEQSNSSIFHNNILKPLGGFLLFFKELSSFINNGQEILAVISAGYTGSPEMLALVPRDWVIRQ